MSNIDTRLLSIFKEISQKDFSAGSELRAQPLFNGTIDLRARELLYVFCKVEKEFKIHIPAEAIMNRSFLTYNGILSTIENCIQV